MLYLKEFDFLLLQVAYSELMFLDLLWPDITSDLFFDKVLAESKVSAKTLRKFKVAFETKKCRVFTSQETHDKEAIQQCLVLFIFESILPHSKAIAPALAAFVKERGSDTELTGELYQAIRRTLVDGYRDRLFGVLCEV